jgi:hypothetical protein
MNPRELIQLIETLYYVRMTQCSNPRHLTLFLQARTLHTYSS